MLLTDSGSKDDAIFDKKPLNVNQLYTWLYELSTCFTDDAAIQWLMQASKAPYKEKICLDYRVIHASTRRIFSALLPGIKTALKETQTLKNASNPMANKNVKIDEDQINTRISNLEAEQALTKFRQDEEIWTQTEQEAEFKTFWEDLVKQGKISY